MNKIPIRDLKADGFFDKPVFIDESYIILTPETPVTQSLINRLIQWEMRELYSEGQLSESETIAPSPEATPDEAEEAKPLISSGDNDREQLHRIKAFYEQFRDYVDKIYTRYVTKNEISVAELSDKVKSLCDIILENRRFVLRVISSVAITNNYLVDHSSRSTVLAIVLGGQLKLPPHRLIELGVASVVHEIGMVRLPPQLYMANRQLAPQERKAITAHPILGYNILKEKKFPLAVSLAALEHHERMNGSGYPRALSAEKISIYARIIAVACSYDAVTGSRPFKAAREGYLGMVDILKNEGKQYDELVIKALVYSLSVYPIGSYIQLTNGKYAQVTDVNPDNPRYPIVTILGARTPDGKEMNIQTSETGLRILKPVSQESALLAAGVKLP
ncbi:MAG: phosphohydrolase [Spirochaetes bacterium GWD1_61_31]|nr:MAG: phosphohydrolase [Spirochaetes bacterium GWB1_60_80]OHD32469.1 MAG: phosphohydrolase [Spirochaetes bacterium GWC1_61_12]OHD42712.1 MAG: phosphohydrolase [Spirochaetes bacterium GWD1_61_31]OHD43749.1 MAG: phosphohydrolase [Spirochaetes bacterium GWE1_60_18]OHD60235.1 MAG: phosphohydrolase [Spirochaetes bacterium GWF1_60_12]HAP44363.1 HD-GYP domain-containing protein [Spirochaetaceae bacterium]